MMNTAISIFVSLIATWMSFNIYTPAVFVSLFFCLVSAYFGYNRCVYTALFIAFSSITAILMSPLILLPEQKQATLMVLILIIVMFVGIGAGVHKLKGH
ncbi:hypothetical protein CWC18_16565 [Pseudoalteromonas aurantia]|uniref:Uncharacterized protein n=1 Tax=Pseudoalteromonas aurantia TaxID=43654 RepID=A0A5S3V6U0_9GAMM|nr:DUF6419 family natural product biosynthesis protein [Pseudoalteromonas aurantia]TMO59067.1 hypothetical protein CWC18_16565 [Pseudoalteromonas aurantia]TMO67420.1 hypothetical protein CWC19_13895 [Pseudoalteromonas aurantia]